MLVYGDHPHDQEGFSPVRLNRMGCPSIFAG